MSSKSTDPRPSVSMEQVMFFVLLEYDVPAPVMLGFGATGRHFEPMNVFLHLADQLGCQTHKELADFVGLHPSHLTRRMTQFQYHMNRDDGLKRRLHGIRALITSYGTDLPESELASIRREHQPRYPLLSLARQRQDREGDQRSM